MREIILEQIKKNKLISGLICAVVLSIVILIILLTLDLTTDSNILNLGSTIVNTTSEVINNNVDITEEKDIQVIDELLHLMDTKSTGCFEIAGRYFVVISTGRSTLDIKYKSLSSIDGRLTFLYYYEDEPDGKFEERHIIIEVSSPDIDIREQTNNIETSGLISVLIDRRGGQKRAFDISNKQEILDLSDIVLLNGLYDINMDSEGIHYYDTLSSIIINDCTVVNKISQTKDTYDVDIGNGYITTIYLDNTQIDVGKTYNFEIEYKDNKLVGNIAYGNELEDINPYFEEGETIYEEATESMD